MYTPTEVATAFWRWFWIGAAGLALLTGLIIGGWQLGWWFQAQNATRQAENTQNGYSNQVTLRQQVTAQPGAAVPALEAQRAAVAAIVCADAAQVTGTPLPAQQAQWAARNCTAGIVSPSSTYYQAG